MVPTPPFPDDAPRFADGRFVIVSRIGQGRSGAVYRGYDMLSGHWRAFKLLSAELAADWEAWDRFVRDGLLVARVAHPNVVRVHEVVGGRAPFLVMSLVTGGTLGRWLERYGAMPSGMACEAALEVARGVAAIHAAGGVHGAIRPHNVLVDASGVRQVSDLSPDCDPTEQPVDVAALGDLLRKLLGRTREASLDRIARGCGAGSLATAAAVEEALAAVRGSLPPDPGNTPDPVLHTTGGERVVRMAALPPELARLVLDDATISPFQGTDAQGRVLLAGTARDPDWIDSSAETGQIRRLGEITTELEITESEPQQTREVPEPEDEPDSVTLQFDVSPGEQTDSSNEFVHQNAPDADNDADAVTVPQLSPPQQAPWTARWPSAFRGAPSARSGAPPRASRTPPPSRPAAAGPPQASRARARRVPDPTSDSGAITTPMIPAREDRARSLGPRVIPSPIETAERPRVSPVSPSRSEGPSWSDEVGFAPGGDELDYEPSLSEMATLTDLISDGQSDHTDPTFHSATLLSPEPSAREVLRLREPAPSLPSSTPNPPPATPRLPTPTPPPPPLPPHLRGAQQIEPLSAGAEPFAEPPSLQRTPVRPPPRVPSSSAEAVTEIEGYAPSSASSAAVTELEVEFVQPPAPIAPPEVPEAPEGSWLSYLLLPASAAFGLFMVFSAILLLVFGMAALNVSSGADAAERQRAELYRAIEQQVGLVDELGARARDVEIERAFRRYDALRAEPEKIEAALALVETIDRVGALHEDGSRISYGLKQLRSARSQYQLALSNWENVAGGPAGRVVVALGIVRGPPEP